MSGALLAVALRQAASPGRLGLILLLGLLPLVVAAVLRATGNDDDLIEAVLDPLVIALFLPIAVLTVATTAFGNEVEDRTLGLLTTKPAPRAYIVLVKLGATLAITAPMVVILAVIVTVMGDSGDPARAALAAAVGAALGVLAYASIFLWAGLITGRALGFGLAYVLIWEALMTSLIDGARFLECTQLHQEHYGGAGRWDVRRLCADSHRAARRADRGGHRLGGVHVLDRASPQQHGRTVAGPPVTPPHRPLSCPLDRRRRLAHCGPAG